MHATNADICQTIAVMTHSLKVHIELQTGRALLACTVVVKNAIVVNEIKQAQKCCLTHPCLMTKEIRASAQKRPHVGAEML
jgi:hypothetical protein